MKAFLKILACILLLGSVLAGASMQGVALYLKKEIPGYLKTVVMEPMRVTVGEIKRGSCLFSACLVLKNIRVDMAGQPTLIIPEAQVSVPMKWPIRADIMVPSSEVGGGDLTLTENQWVIRMVKINWNGAEFQAQGTVDRLRETGEIVVGTKGLKQLIQKINGAPKWVGMMLKNKPMMIKLQPKDGFLRWQGLPLIPI